MVYSYGQLMNPFQQRRRYQQIAFALLGIFVIGVGFATSMLWWSHYLSQNEQIFWFYAILAVPALIYVAFSWFNWRCPKCDHFLGWGLKLKQCRVCNFPIKPILEGL